MSGFRSLLLVLISTKDIKAEKAYADYARKCGTHLWLFCELRGQWLECHAERRLGAYELRLADCGLGVLRLDPADATQRICV
ncbi:hypothetical protein LA080_011510 [Diaporthe eres]|nr:hypothetical protein LA080_011510 [Diaporthe eres]